MVDNEANELPAPEGEGLGVGSVISCSAEFPNCFWLSLRPATVGSAAASISIYNAIKSAAVSRIANPDIHCGRITNSPELEINPTWPPLSKGSGTCWASPRGGLEGVILLLKIVNTQKYFLGARRAVFGFPMGGSNLSNGRKQKFRQSEENQAPAIVAQQPKNSCRNQNFFVPLLCIWDAPRIKAAAQHSSSELGSTFALHFICNGFKKLRAAAAKERQVMNFRARR